MSVPYGSDDWNDEGGVLADIAERLDEAAERLAERSGWPSVLKRQAGVLRSAALLRGWEGEPTELGAIATGTDDEIDALRGEAMKQLVVLLDLNYTFVANTSGPRRNYREKIREESYRSWLIPLFQEAKAKVHLITVRRDYYAWVTRDQIRRACDGWEPHGYHFNPDDRPAPAHKRDVLRRRIFPRYGQPDEGVRYLALESAAATRRMYVQHGIPVWRITLDDDRRPWGSLPAGVLNAANDACAGFPGPPTGGTAVIDADTAGQPLRRGQPENR